MEDLRKRAIYCCTALEKHYGKPNFWGHDWNAMDLLVSTILSQNTSDKVSFVAFQHLKTAFPKWELVLSAPEGEVANAIRFGGLANIKAKRIKATLQQVWVECQKRKLNKLTLDFVKEMPKEEAIALLTSFKGVGMKTASVVLLFAFKMPFMPVDTHIFRQLKRIGLLDKKATLEQAHEAANTLFPDAEKYSCHLNLIENGRKVCLARNPKCEACPLNKVCDFGIRRLEFH